MSQFSLYDAFASETLPTSGNSGTTGADPSNVQKRNLQNMMKIDTNIFRDISTTKHNIPSEESMHLDAGFNNIKVVRLKSSTYWLDYVCVFPKLNPVIQK